MSAPKFEKNIAGNRDPNESGAVNGLGPEKFSQVCGMLRHRCRTLSDPGAPMRAQIRQNEPIARREHRKHRAPELTTYRERMKQYDRKSSSLHFIINLRVTTANLHSQLSVAVKVERNYGR